MFTILGSDGKEYGPVTAGQILEWIKAGRANMQTKVRRGSDTDWKTIGEIPEFGGTPPPASAETPPTLEPVAVPLPTYVPLQGTPAEIAATLAENAAGFDFFSCLSRSFELWRANFLPLVGITFLIMAIQMVLGFIPILGGVAGILFNGAFTGGLYYYYMGKIRGEPREVSDAFFGFNKALLPLILTNLIMTAVLLLIMIPFFGPFFFTVMKVMLQGGGATPVDFPVLSGLSILSLCVGMIPLLYLSVSWIFAFALVIDQGLGPWTALEVSRRVITRRWFSVFALMICGAILALIGLFMLFVGFFIAMPLFIGAIVYAYEDLCRAPRA